MGLLIKDINISDVLEIRTLLSVAIQENNEALGKTTDIELQNLIKRQGEMLQKIYDNLDYSKLENI